MAYNPFQTNSEQFYRYVAYKSEEPEKLTIENDLFGQFELPGNYSYNPVTGNVLAPANTPEVKEYDWSEMNKLGETHGELDQEFNQNRSVKQDLQGNKKRAMEFFQSKGLNAHQAAGIVGNLIVESSLNTTIKGDGGKAFGLAQWHPDRQKGLKLLAQKRNTDISDFDTQLEYVWEELNSGYKTALNKIMNSKNTKEATTAFMKHYEQPGIPHFERRLQEAESLLL